MEVARPETTPLPGTLAMNRPLLFAMLALSFASIAGNTDAALADEQDGPSWLSGKIYDEWRANAQFLGSPTGGQFGITASTGPGQMAYCYQSAILWKQNAARAFHVRGDIYRTYSQLGGPQGRLGFPTSNGFVYNAQGHHAQHFEKGTIFWSESAKQFITGPAGQLPRQPATPWQAGTIAPIKFNQTISTPPTVVPTVNGSTPLRLKQK
jgi:uncharacterized protein with LGFP repeats